MRRLRLALVALLAALALPVTSLAAPSLELIGEVRLPTGLMLGGTEVGGLSGLVFDPASGLFLAISDGEGESGPVRWYALRVDLDDGRLSDGDVTFVGVTSVKDVDGGSFAGRVVDPEGIALADDGSLYISTEGGEGPDEPPFIRHQARDGGFLAALEPPAKFVPDPQHGTGTRSNLAYEGLTVLPGSGLLFAGVENALRQDGPEADFERASPCRILKVGLERGVVLSETVYVVDRVSQPASGGRGMSGLADLIALDADHLLALERSYVRGVGTGIKLFLVDLSGATDVASIPSLQAVDPASFRPAGKELLLDLATLGITLDNLEGMALGPVLPDGRASLVIISDNNFNRHGQVTQLLAFAVDGLPASALPAPRVSIPELQGAGHWSPFVGNRVVGVSGVVTSLVSSGRRDGFFMQDAYGDGNDATSDAVWVVPRSGQPAMAVGDLIEASGTVQELGEADALPMTTLGDAALRVVRHGAQLPAEVTLGAAGRELPPVVDDDALAVFAPDRGSADLLESLEGMRVRLNYGVVAGPTSRHGELAVVPDGKLEGARRTARGGVLQTPTGSGPQPLMVAFVPAEAAPQVKVGDPVADSFSGVLDYGYGSYRLVVTQVPLILAREQARAATGLVAGAGTITLATLNVENLSAQSPAAKLEEIAKLLVERLRSPTVVALEEVQDDSGPADDSTVSAVATLTRLVAAIAAAGGPSYSWHQVDPENGRDGGQKGGNIRVALLVDPSRVKVVTRGAGRATDTTRVAPNGGLTLSPGRVAAKHPAFTADAEHPNEGTRKPLALELSVDGRRLVVVVVHLISQRGDDQPFGPRQPRCLVTRTRRTEQTLAVRPFVEELRRRDPSTGVVVMGDFNDIEASPPLVALTAGDLLVDLVERLPYWERYTYVFRGVAQALDHVLVSSELAAAAEVDVVHANADLPAAERASDHDPLVVRLTLAPATQASR